MEDFKKDIDSNTIIVGDFNTPLSKMDRSSKQNINKDIVALNNALDEMDLIDIHRAFHPKETKYTFFSNAHGTFSKIDHMRGHKASLNKFKKIEIISSIFSDQKGLKLETNPKGKNPKTKQPKKTFEINNPTLHPQELEEQQQRQPRASRRRK